MKGALKALLSVIPPTTFSDIIHRDSLRDPLTPPPSPARWERAKETWSMRGRSVVQEVLRLYFEDASSAHLARDLLLPSP